LELFLLFILCCGKGIMVRGYLEAPDLRGMDMKTLLEKANERRLEAFEAVDPEAKRTTAVGLLGSVTVEEVEEKVATNGAGAEDEKNGYFVQAHV
jgi:hypothetical protein